MSIIYGFILGIATAYLILKSRKGMKYLIIGKKPNLLMDAYLGTYRDNNGERTDSRCILFIKITNQSDQSLQLESWFLKILNGRGFLNQVFVSPQNLQRHLHPGESFSIEIENTMFLKDERLYTVVVKDIYAREWEISYDKIKSLKSEYFWEGI